MKSEASGADAMVADVLRRGRELVSAPRRPIDFQTGNEDAETILNDLERYPHLFVFGCIMDRQIKYGRAWLIPYRIGREIGGFEFKEFRKLSLQKIEELFQRGRYHRFNTVMAHHLCAAIQRVDQSYDGNAAAIWRNRPSSALVIRRMLEFDGVGIKIATMAANILVREFKVPLRDLSSIDISPDSRVTRFFKRNGLLRENASPAELIYLARELSPEFPGLLDYAAFIDGGFRRKQL